MVDVMILFKENCKEKWRGVSLRPNFHNPASPYILTLWVCSFFDLSTGFVGFTMTKLDGMSFRSNWGWSQFIFIKSKKIRNFQVYVQKNLEQLL